MSYSPRKAAQSVAFFTMKNGGRPLNTLKAVKLVYLADRESISSYGFPIQEERRVAMKLGPVNSVTYNYIKGEVPPEEDGGWSDFVSDREQHNIGLSDPSISLGDLDELSDADLAALGAVWEKFGHMSQWDLVKWTHDQCNVPEWKDPNGSSVTIRLEEMMVAIGCPNAMEATEEFHSVARASDFLRGL